MDAKACCSDPETQQLSSVGMSLLSVQQTASISASKVEGDKVLVWLLLNW